MNGRRDQLVASFAAFLAATLATVPCLASDSRVYEDPADDASFRPTSADGLYGFPPSPPIDLLRLEIGAWSTQTPVSDPYSGCFENTSAPHLVRIDLVVKGLIAPPGPLTGPVFPDPYRFGERPLYGFIDLDVDRNRDTGGELTANAANRFLANVARFGAMPGSLLASRVVIDGKELDGSYETTPQYERSGADFGLVLCGCFTPTVVSETGVQNGQMDPGETMVVRGRFFQRAGGYKPSSFMLGGSGPGMYDPLVNLQFSHSLITDKTTISLVYALDMNGAAQLAGTASQLADTSASNHTSVYEGILELIARADGNAVNGLPYELIREWKNVEAKDCLDPRDWRATALIGTAHAGSAISSPYLWTDIGFECDTGDVNGDGEIDALDSDAIAAAINALDGTPDDADGMVNFSVEIPNFPVSFSIYDINYDGRINANDITIQTWFCQADWNQSGDVTADDIFAYLDDWFAGNGDFNGFGGTTADDIFAYLDAWFTGCY